MPQRAYKKADWIYLVTSILVHWIEVNHILISTRVLFNDASEKYGDTIMYCSNKHETWRQAMPGDPTSHGHN